MKKVFYVFIIFLVVLIFVGCKANVDVEENINDDHITSEVILVGTIDNNSFEAILEEMPTAFRIYNAPDELEKAKAVEGDLIKITWYTNEQGQNIVIKITK